MEIKEALQQNKDFSNPYSKALVNVHYTAAQIGADLHQTLQPFDISSQQFNILRILRGQQSKSVTVKFLIERMIDKSSNASRLVDKLVAKGYVSRHQCASDRRQVDVCISKEGLDFLEKVSAALEVSQKKYAERLTEEECEQLSSLLDKIRG